MSYLIRSQSLRLKERFLTIGFDYDNCLDELRVYQESR